MGDVNEKFRKDSSIALRMGSFHSILVRKERIRQTAATETSVNAGYGRMRHVPLLSRALLPRMLHATRGGSCTNCTATFLVWILYELLTDYESSALTDTMKQTPALEADSRSADQEISQLLWILKA